MSRLSSNVEAIEKIVGKLRAMNPKIHTEGLFVRDPSTPLFFLIPWVDFPPDQLNRVKTELRRGDDFTIGERSYVDEAERLTTVIGVAFASDELLPKYGLEMDGRGIVSQLKK